MTWEYLFIDDEVGSAAPAELYSDKIGRHSDDMLNFTATKPGSLSETLRIIADKQPNGVILDVSFTNALSDGKPLAFDGIALAQQIRTLQTRQLAGSAGLPPFPIVRLSKKDVILEYVNGDTTSDDLFDDKMDKDEIISHPQAAAHRLSSLAADYPQIVAFGHSEKTDDNVANLCGVGLEFLSRLDQRMFLGLLRVNSPPHVLARDLLSSVVVRAGPLVDEQLLSVRLGIDRSRSPDWSRLLETFTEAAYRGCFAGGYRRWWMPLVQDWWSRELPEAAPLQRTGATERVEGLRAKTSLTELEPLAVNPLSPGERFWHICMKSNDPVDPAHGVAMLPVYGQESWHDADYLSLEEAKRDVRNRRIRPLDRTRILAARRPG